MTDAAQLPPAPAPSTSRVRQHRQREREGRCMLRVVVSEVSLESLLVARGFLPPYGADERQELERALGDFLEALADTAGSAETRYDALLQDALD